MWMVIGLVIVIAILFSSSDHGVAKNKAKQQDPMAAINQWYDGVLDKQTSQRQQRG